MKLLTPLCFTICLYLFSCGGSDSKKTETVDETLKTEIIQNDSIASDLETVENEINSAAEELDNALNDLEIE